MVSIITPAHNEENIVAGFVSRAVSFLRQKKISGEVIVVENGSKDKTPEILKTLTKKYKELVVVKLPAGNKGLALKRGMEVASGKYILTLDTDLWDQDFVSESIRNLEKYDVVVGSKAIIGSKDERPLGNRLLNWGYNFVFSLVFNLRGTETHAKLSFQADKIMPLVGQCQTEDLNFDTELIIRAERAGLTKVEIPTVVQEIRPRRYSIAAQLVKTARNFWILLTTLKPSPNWSYVVLGVALLLAFIMRFYHFSDWFFFSVDEEHYSYMTRMITVGHHFPLIGGPISGTKLYMAPWFLYFNAVWFLLSNNNPVFSGAIFATLELAVTFFVYLLGKKLFSPPAGAVGAVLFAGSFLLALFDRHYWNITLTPLISVVSFYGLLRWLDGSKKWLVMTALVVSFGLSSTFSNFAVFLFATLVIFWFRKRDLLLFLGTITLLHLPLVLFDLRHNFWLTRGLWEFLTMRAGENLSLTQRLITTLTLFIHTLAKSLVITMPLNISDETSICSQGIFHYQPAWWAIALAVLILIVAMRRKNLLLIFLLAGVNIFSLVFFRADPEERHFLPFLPLFFVLAGVFFTQIRWGIAIVLLLLILNFYSLFNSYASYGLPDKKRAVDFIISQTQSKKFGLDVVGECHRWGYRYLFSQYNHEPATSYLDPSFFWMYDYTPDPTRATVKATIVSPNQGQIAVYVQ